MEKHKWQYLCEEVPEDDGPDRLAMWGAKGWELVTVLPKVVQNDGPVGEPGPRTLWTLIFKHPGGPLDLMNG